MAIKHTVEVRSGIFEEKNLTPLKAIRLKCLECSNFSPQEVKDCQIDECALWPFRSGKSGLKMNLTPEQRKAVGDRLRKSNS